MNTLLESTSLAMEDRMELEHQAKILIVDDNQGNLFSLEIVLANEHYQIVRATSGKEALRILLKEQDFSLLLIDVNMPIMDGFETTELIRQNEKLRHIPVIFLTAYFATPEHIFRGYQTGAVDYMLKPLVPEILRAKVAIFVDLHRKNKELSIQRKKLLHFNKSLKQYSDGLIQINQELEKFAYVVSHDMQEPLRTITSYIRLLEKNLGNKLDGESKEFMDFILNASQRMRSIIIGLLEYARIGTQDETFETVDCDVVIKDVLDNLEEVIQDSGARIEVEHMPVIQGNYTLFVQLFQNLIGNAIKFRREQAPVIRISCTSTDDQDLFSVKDNGIGIEKEYEHKIFEIFQRLHNPGEYVGVGLGLAICKKIVERHHGKIWMTSEPNNGTTFSFTIQKTTEPVPEKAELQE
jgi:signal transduction histidine kinase